MAADKEVVIPHDSVNEGVVVAAAISDVTVRAKLLRRITSDRFLEGRHRRLWDALRELQRRGLEYDPASLNAVASDIDVDYVVALQEQRPDVPPNLEFHVEALFWDHARASAVQGPISAFLKALQDPKESPERVRALSRQVAMAFDGYKDRKYLRDTSAVIQEQLAEIRERMLGRAVYPYGVKGLDEYEEGNPDIATYGQHRVVPGAKPGLVTVITGLSGAGKTTLTGNVVLGLARQKRRVLWGAWEVGPGMNMEMLAAMSLGISRTRLQTGNITKEEYAKIAARMERLSPWVRFMDLPFGREVGEKGSNDRNLDLIHQYLADAGCEIFVADVWNRCLVDRRPEAEDAAVYRQQSIARETSTHCIVIHQQRLGDLEKRKDPMPTREGIKGAKGLVEVADTMFGVHKPSMFKEQPNETLQVVILKQRYGRWPLVVEFDFDADRGIITGGTSIKYERNVEGNDERMGF